MAGASGVGFSPADTGLGAATRFVVELAAWVLIAVAVGDAFGWPAGVVAVVLLTAATGTFNAAGDKQKQGVIVPGPARLALEIGLAVGLVVAAGILWGAPGAVAGLVLVAAAGFAGRRRAAWLLGRWQPDA